MRIIYREITGEKVVKHFKSWPALCDWLKREYPFVSAANDAREAFGFLWL